MKRNILTIALAAISIAASAQQNFKMELDETRQFFEANFKSNVQERRNVKTEGMPLLSLFELHEFQGIDKHDFEIYLISLREAFDKDKANKLCYNVVSQSEGLSNKPTSIAIGTENGGTLTLGGSKDKNLMMLCFLDENDSTRSFRYAYAIEWSDSKENNKKLEGKIVISYAKIPSIENSTLDTNVISYGTLSKPFIFRKDVMTDEEMQQYIKDFKNYFPDMSNVDVSDKGRITFRFNSYTDSNITDAGSMLARFDVLKESFLQSFKENSKSAPIKANMICTHVKKHHTLCDDLDKQYLFLELQDMITELQDMIFNLDKSDASNAKSCARYLRIARDCMGVTEVDRNKAKDKQHK